MDPKQIATLKLAAQKGVREAWDLDSTCTFRFEFLPAEIPMASLHPQVCVSDNLDAARKEALANQTSYTKPALAAAVNGVKGDADFAATAENIIRAARLTAQFCGGRTLDLRVVGGATVVEAARLVYWMERDHFDGLYVNGVKAEEK